MTRAGFERRVLEMWVTTRVPLTRTNVQFFTGASRGKVDKWLDQLVADGVLEVDCDDEGEMLWLVRGAERSKSGPSTLEDAAKLDRLRSEAGAGTALERVGAAALVKATLGGGKGGSGAALDGGGDKKSLVASGVLSFFFGPLGWLYAAPLRSALPAILVYLLVCAVLPNFLLAAILGIANPIAALAGVGFAWRYNQNGRRTPLLGETPDDRPLLPKR